MPKNVLGKRDDRSINFALAALRALRCPDPRRGEGTEEWERTKGSYPYTPDVVAGPLVGGGDPSDFYIDVFEPKGDQYVRPEAGNPLAAVTLLRAVVDQGSFNLADLEDAGEHFVKPMNDKLLKYVGSRGNTPMFGLAMHLRLTGNQGAGQVVAAYRALDVIDGAFGITHYLGQVTKDAMMREVMTGEPAPGRKGLILGLPIAQPLSFLLVVVQRVDRPRIILLVNEAALSGAHPFASHPVIRWLATIWTAPNT
jgi:hypothetical protein